MAVKGSVKRSTFFMRRMRALWDEGLSITDIGERLGVTRDVIAGLSRRNDFPSRPSPLGGPLSPEARVARDDEMRAERARGGKIVDIAAKAGISPCHASAVIRGNAHRRYCDRKKPSVAAAP